VTTADKVSTEWYSAQTNAYQQMTFPSSQSMHFCLSSL
jgi:hypothetical protein